MRTPKGGKCNRAALLSRAGKEASPRGQVVNGWLELGRERESARRAELVTGKTLKPEMMEEVQLLALTSRDGTVSTVEHRWQGGRGTETR